MPISLYMPLLVNVPALSVKKSLVLVIWPDGLLSNPLALIAMLVAPPAKVRLPSFAIRSAAIARLS